MALAAYYAKLVYNANGGSGAPAAQSAYSDEPGASVYVILGAAPSRQYYTFKGWAPSSSASSGRTPGQKYYMTTSTTLYAANARIYNLYATWQRNTVLIGYDPNGGSGSAWYQTVNQGEQITLSSTVPTRAGYKFLGWATSASATAPAYQAGGKATFTRETRLYAVWEISNSTISSITGSVPIDGTTHGSVSISSINSSYSHELTISIGNSSQVISLAAGVTSATFTIPTSWLADVPNSATGTARASLKTFNGSTQVGVADVKTFSITVPASVVPSVSVATDYVNSNAVVDGWDILLQNYSQIKLTATAAGGTGASVSNIAFSGDGLSQTGTENEATSAILTSSGSRSWTVTVTDSRGRTVSTVVTDTVHEYFSPSIESLVAFRSDSSGNRDDAAGTYINATGVFSYASADGNNTLSVDAIEYRAEDAQSWTVGEASAASGNSYNFGGGLINETKMFHVRLSLEDALGNSAEFVVDVSPIIGYAFGLKNDRVHFGGPCKEPGFVCDFPAKLVNGHIVGSHSAAGNYAKILTFGTDVTTGKNLAPVNSWSTGRRWWGSNINSAGLLGSVLETLPAGTYTLSWRYTLTAIPQDTTTTLQVGKYIRVKYDGTYHILSSYSLTTIPSYAVGDSYSVQATITIDSAAVGQAFEVLAYCGQADSFYATLTEYQIEIGSQKTTFEPYVNPSNINVNAPITIEYVKTGDVSPTTLTISFNRDYSLNSFTKDAAADAYLVNSAAAQWDLYIGKSSSSDSVEILDMHNPWSNTDLTVEWEDSSVSTLPSGAVSAVPVNTVISISPDGVSVANNAWKTVASITLPRGIWILSGYTQFNSNSTGIRSTVLSASQDSGTSTRNMSSDLNNNTGNNSGKLHFFDVYQVASQTTYYLNAYQNSGSAITTYGRITAIKIV